MGNREPRTRVTHRKGKQAGTRRISGAVSRHTKPTLPAHAPTLPAHALKSQIQKPGESVSYASAVRGGPAPMEDKRQESVKEHILDISARDFIVTEKNCACYGKARDFLNLPTL
ncbi:hypothetical protein LXL04_017894 [Taraxacum kok-saghyz]